MLAAAPPASAVTPELIEAAKKEGKVVYYTSIDLPLAEKIAKSFEAKYPGIAVRVERTGAERVFQRIGQEYGEPHPRGRCGELVRRRAFHRLEARWHPGAVTCRRMWRSSIRPSTRTPTALFASFRIGLCIIACNTNLVKTEDAPKSFADLLDPKWTGKIVKAHPGYSGTIMTATFQMVRDLGWAYFEKLAQQNVMQLQSASDPPKKLALGERAVQADGNEYNMFQIKEAGRPVEPVYATEGTPLVVGPNGLFKNAPNPNAARLFQSYCFRAECQQLISDVGGLRSVHPQVKEKAGRKPFKEIKTMKEDAAGVEKMGEEIKARYSKLFKV